MNKAKIFNDLKATYLNGDNDLINDFKDYLRSDSLQVETAGEIVNDIEIFKADIKDDLSTADMTDPSDQWIFKNVKAIKAFTKHEMNCIDNADESDLFITNYNTGNDSIECRIMTDLDLSNVVSELYNFLKDETLSPYKIKWLLKHVNISDVKLAKKVNLSHQQINFFRRGKRNILNMSLESALRFEKYYDELIGNKLHTISDNIYPEPV